MDFDPQRRGDAEARIFEILDGQKRRLTSGTGRKGTHELRIPVPAFRVQIPLREYGGPPAGNQIGSLRGPGGSDFDLYLWRWNGTSWVQVASATSVSTNENITYNGAAGWYLWGTYSYSGSGTYHFYYDHP